ERALSRGERLGDGHGIGGLEGGEARTRTVERFGCRCGHDPGDLGGQGHRVAQIVESERDSPVEVCEHIGRVGVERGQRPEMAGPSFSAGQRLGGVGAERGQSGDGHIALEP
ncbi:MAG: hypothetical protein ACK56I_25295, partial [bacterium]